MSIHDRAISGKLDCAATFLSDLFAGSTEANPIYLASLPRVFGTDVASIPANIPYLQVEPERVQRWAKRLGADEALRVGLVWAGNPQHPNDRYRSMALEALAPLWLSHPFLLLVPFR